MNKFIAVLLVPALYIVASCGDKGSSDESDVGEYFVEADFTLTDGDEYYLLEECDMSSSESNDYTIWNISGSNLDKMRGVSFDWSQEFVDGPGSYNHSGSWTPFEMFVWVLRPGIAPGRFRYSLAHEGRITFEEVGYESGDIVHGTFEGILLDGDEWDDTVHIQVENGSFRCVVP